MKKLHTLEKVQARFARLDRGSLREPHGFSFSSTGAGGLP